MSTTFFSTYWPRSVGPAGREQLAREEHERREDADERDREHDEPEPGEHARDQGESRDGLDDGGEDERQLAADDAEGQRAPGRLDERLEGAGAGEELQHAEGDEDERRARRGGRGCSTAAGGP